MGGEFRYYKVSYPVFAPWPFSKSARNEVRLRITLAGQIVMLPGYESCLGGKQSPGISLDGTQRPDYCQKADD